MPDFAIIDAPSNLGLRATGVEQLPTALKAAGLMTGLNATYAGRIDIPTHDLTRDPVTGVLHQAGVEVVTRRLAHLVADTQRSAYFPLVLGGDCSIELGTMLGMRQSGMGNCGLFFLDGHADFYSPTSEPTGEIASMDLALVTGHGPDALTNIDQFKPYVRENDVALFGFRDMDEYTQDGSPEVRNSGIRCFDMDIVRRLGLVQATTLARDHLLRDDLAGFWIHLDADVLDDDDMPAVDYRLPKDGLRFQELSEILRLLLATERVVGMSITIFNPLLDTDGSVAQKFVACLLDGLRS